VIAFHVYQKLLNLFLKKMVAQQNINWNSKKISGREFFEKSDFFESGMRTSETQLTRVSHIGGVSQCHFFVPNALALGVIRNLSF
jgi:hypothetical protein